MLSATAIAVVRMRSLFSVVMLFGVYSLLSANIFMVLDAVDVAFTEAAVGAGISTVLMLSTLLITGTRQQANPKQTAWIPLAVVTVTGAVLVWSTLDMPHFGQADNPAHQHVAPRYIETSPQEVGVPNMVTSVLASYRGYDTMGETIVVFAALVGVLALLGIKRTPQPAPIPARTQRTQQQRKRQENKPPTPPLQVISKLLIPFILLFALYVQFHGDFGPGGGFQAGVIFAAAIILYAITYDINAALQLTPVWLVRSFAALGVLLYGGTGIITMLMGGQFLDYNVLAADPVHGQHYGILLVELGVGITVASAMLLIFYAFASRGSTAS